MAHGERWQAPSAQRHPAEFPAVELIPCPVERLCQPVPGAKGGDARVLGRWDCLSGTRQHVAALKAWLQQFEGLLGRIEALDAYGYARPDDADRGGQWAHAAVDWLGARAAAASGLAARTR